MNVVRVFTFFWLTILGHLNFLVHQLWALKLFKNIVWWHLPCFWFTILQVEPVLRSSVFWKSSSFLESLSFHCSFKALKLYLVDHFRALEELFFFFLSRSGNIDSVTCVHLIDLDLFFWLVEELLLCCCFWIELPFPLSPFRNLI